MTNYDLRRPLIHLFQLSESLRLGDLSAEQEAVNVCEKLLARGADAAFQGLPCMRDLLKSLVQGRELELGISPDTEPNLGADARQDGEHLPTESGFAAVPTYPSLGQLARHLSAWLEGFVPLLIALGPDGEDALGAALQSQDYQIATLATMLLAHPEFAYMWDRQSLSETFAGAESTALRIELGRLLLGRYSDDEWLRAEVGRIVPQGLSASASVQEGHWSEAVLLWFRKLTIWDIVTEGAGPKARWPGSWQ